MAKRS
jgi:myotubularin-related protein 1/2